MTDANTPLAVMNPALSPELQAKFNASTEEWKPYLHFLKDDYYLGQKPLERPLRKISDNDDWLEDFHKTSTVFAETDTWDRHQLTCWMLVPKGLDVTRDIVIQVLFHGGGLTTGGGLYAHWYADYKRSLQMKKNAVTLIPMYRLMPEARGAEIEQDVDSWWDYYKSGACESWVKDTLATVQLGNGVEVKMDRLMISGESAGALLAVYSWLTQKNLPITVLYLQYPMLEYYQRPMPEKLEFMGRDDIAVEDVQAGIDAMINKSDEMRKAGGMVARSDTPPPIGMQAAFGLSILGRWKGVYMNGKETPDALTRLRKQAMKPECLPTIVITHGADDSNCPVERIYEFVSLLYGKGWGKDFFDRLLFEIVPRQGHAFDYDIPYPSPAGQRWLVKCLRSIEMAW